MSGAVLARRIIQAFIAHRLQVHKGEGVGIAREQLEQGVDRMGLISLTPRRHKRDYNADDEQDQDGCTANKPPHHGPTHSPSSDSRSDILNYLQR